MTAVLLSIATFFSTAAGGFLALHRRQNLFPIMAFSAGILVAAALLDLLPDAFDLAGRSGASSDRVLLAAAIGFLVFYGLDSFVHMAAAGHIGGVSSVGFGTIAALGLTTHSFLDGFAIGSAFRAHTGVGVLVAIAVISHDFGDGVSTVTVVLGSRKGRRPALAWLAADAVAPVVGAGAALLVSLPGSRLAELLGFFAGSFVFIGAAHLLPESQQGGHSKWLAAALLGGFAFVFVVTRLLS